MWHLTAPEPGPARYRGPLGHGIILNRTPRSGELRSRTEGGLGVSIKTASKAHSQPRFSSRFLPPVTPVTYPEHLAPRPLRSPPSIALRCYRLTSD
jgi:hypothetical protein